MHTDEDIDFSEFVDESELEDADYEEDQDVTGDYYQEESAADWVDE